MHRGPSAYVLGPPPSRGRDLELEGGVNACHVEYVYESRDSMTFIPALIGRPPLNEDTRALLALPARLGGLGIIDLTRSCQAMYLASSLISSPLTSLISVQQDDYSYDCIAAQLKAKAEVKSLR